MNKAIPATLHPLARICGVFAAVAGAVATTMGAVGSHWVASRADAHFAAAFQTATAFALWHALALGGLGFGLQMRANSRLLRAAAACWMSGIVLFCGSLWLRGLGVDPRIVAIAPAGGSLLILGWLAVAIALLRIPAAR
jgi:uncharacterized membrane protein YgdD (TMEM256/DUF423 family)